MGARQRQPETLAVRWDAEACLKNTSLSKALLQGAINNIIGRALIFIHRSRDKNQTKNRKLAELGKVEEMRVKKDRFISICSLSQLVC